MLPFFNKRVLTALALALTPLSPLAFSSAAAQQAAAAPIAQPASAPANPALWVMRDEDTTIYLFGTVHVLRPDLDWFNGHVRAAFDASDEVKLEVLLPEDPAALAPVVMRYAIDPDGRTMTSRLTPEQLQAYTTGMDAIGIPVAAVDQLEPWLIGLTLGQVMVQRSGYSGESGAERVLTAAANASGKPISALETFEDQIEMLDSAPASEQIHGILDVLGRFDEAASTFDAMVASWANGDPDATSAVMNQAMASSPETFRILLTDRNRRWAETLAARMDQPGTLFVAVGAGHLAGEGSVQQFLAERGLTVERVSR